MPPSRQAIRNLDICQHPRHNLSRGSVLIVGLFLLLLITIITLASINLPSMELKMSHNSELQTQAFAAAEDGLLSAEHTITGNFGGIPNNVDADENSCIYFETGDTQDPSWCNASPTDADFNGSERHYQVQYLGPMPLELGNGSQLTDRYFFAAKGSGSQSSSNRQVESVVMTTDLFIPKN